MLNNKRTLIITIFAVASLNACSQQQVIGSTVAVAKLPVKVVGAAAGTAGSVVGGTVGGAVGGSIGRKVGSAAGQSAGRNAVPSL
ncbi:MAG TPA: hypothetical protein EYH16_03275 [Leucothrix mucor]|nr:hypothetical protein [Leucothrix mucor]